jgi:alkanesulfonate monooxygenase SsuD/methylene tetrahydromethanopterin reductase-like flavin-dependent oxidoreductase (luciferase family)
MLFSLWANSTSPTSEILDISRTADETGWFGVWIADHYMPNTGSEEFSPGDMHECWALLAAIAAVTENVRVGPLVSPTSIHHPALLANRATTIDHLSNGRMVLGLGAGWQINEHKAYGIDLEAPGKRVSRFEESIEITRSLLDNDRTTFSGEHYQFTDAPCDPKPIQSKLPIVVGTGSPRMLRITSKHAQEWNTWGAPEMAAGRCAEFEKACEATGTDPASIHRSVQALIFMTDDAEKGAAIKGGDMGERSIVGSNDQIVEELGRYAELGFHEVIVPDFNLGKTLDQRKERYAQFASEIAPQLK